MAEHDHDAVDARLRAAGERLRTTAPAATTGPTGASDGQSWRPWHAGAAVMVAAAAAVVAFIVFPGSADETIRELPADLPTSDPVTTLDPDTPETGTPTTDTPTTETPETTDDPIDMGPARLIHEAEFDGWDGAGGQCAVLRIDAPLVADEIRLCVTGPQIEFGVTAYVRSQDVEWSLRLTSTNAAEGQNTQSGTGWFAFDDAPCGPPAHDVPDDRWVLVSHCTDGAALYTLPPAAPGENSAVSVGTVHGPEIRLAVLTDSIEVESARGSQRIDVVDVAPVEIGGATADCVLVVPAGAIQWFETCSFGDEGVFNLLVSVHEQAFVLEQVGRLRLDPLAPSAVLRAHGCSTPVADVLHAMADPDGLPAGEPGLLVTGLACSAAESPLDNPSADQHATAQFAGVHLRRGPVDGGLVELERDGAGDWSIIDMGTGIEPDLWPLPFPGPEQFTTDADLLPPVDVTATLRTGAGTAETTDELIQAISAYLVDLHEPEAGDPPEAMPMAGGLQTSTGGDRVGLITAELRYLDDSTSSGSYSIWISEPESGGPATIERAYLTSRCSRGVTESEGVLLCL